MALEVGEILQGRYRVERPLRCGGMGAVYVARDGHLQGLCALKEMYPARDEWALRRFREEAQILSRLHHPAIPKVRDYFVVEDGVGARYYLVMDYVEGRNLQQEAEQGRLSEARCREDVLAVLEILEYLHALEPPIVHRDVKPSNLIREESSGKLFLVDFGLARLASEETQTSAGTMTFCAPEQILGKAEARSDLYSLAATFYVLLTGETVQLGKAKPLLALRPDLSVQLATTLDRAL